MQELASLVDPLLELCREAGVLICRHYHAPGTTDFEYKDDRSPLTLADTESNVLLQAGLAALDPQLPILSEESPPAALVGRRSWQRFWLVDPLDGTKEFLAGTGEFTINIALIEDHRVTHTLLVPTLYQALLDRGSGRETWPDVVIVAGTQLVRAGAAVDSAPVR